MASVSIKRNLCQDCAQAKNSVYFARASGAPGAWGPVWGTAPEHVGPYLCDYEVSAKQY